jgi:hypothetical protein
VAEVAEVVILVLLHMEVEAAERLVVVMELPILVAVVEVALAGQVVQVALVS